MANMREIRNRMKSIQDTMKNHQMPCNVVSFF